MLRKVSSLILSLRVRSLSVLCVCVCVGCFLPACLPPCLARAEARQRGSKSRRLNCSSAERAGREREERCAACQNSGRSQVKQKWSEGKIRGHGRDCDGLEHPCIHVPLLGKSTSCFLLHRHTQYCSCLASLGLGIVVITAPRSPRFDLCFQTLRRSSFPRKLLPLSKTHRSRQATSVADLSGPRFHCAISRRASLNSQRESTASR